jgi:hypothetical protein
VKLNKKNNRQAEKLHDNNIFEQNKNNMKGTSYLKECINNQSILTDHRQLQMVSIDFLLMLDPTLQNKFQPQLFKSQR